MKRGYEDQRTASWRNDRLVNNFVSHNKIFC